MNLCLHCRLNASGCPLDGPRQTEHCVEYRPGSDEDRARAELILASAVRAAPTSEEGRRRMNKLMEVIAWPSSTT